MSFGQIDFGSTAAEEEVDSHPQLLLNGYFDLQDAARNIGDGRKFLLLGYKGSGKSAVLQNLRLRADTNDQVVSYHKIGGFPFNEFARIAGGVKDDTSSFASAWTTLLLLASLESLMSDPDVSGRGDRRVQQAYRRLQDVGLSPSDDLKSLVNRVNQRSGQVGLAKLGAAYQGQVSANRDFAGANFNGSIFLLIQNLGSTHKHLVCVDGLDENVVSGPQKAKILVALIETVEALNARFREALVPVKLVVAVRTDIYDRLPSTNTPKYSQDSAVRLDWYHDIRHPERSHLMDLVNRKARVSIPDVGDIFEEYLPRSIRVGQKGRRLNTRGYLLMYTRHTPRDMLRLLTYIQAKAGGARVTDDHVLGALYPYSAEYFVPEVRAELRHELNERDIEAALELLENIHRQSFTLDQAERCARDNGIFHKNRVVEILKALYAASAIGNRTLSPDHQYYYTFKYRTQQASLARTRMIFVHNALTRALNIPLEGSNLDPALIMENERGPGQRRRTRGGQDVHEDQLHLPDDPPESAELQEDPEDQA